MVFSNTTKRKQYVLTPQGKPLYEDGNSFGTKMLEKMGWSKGKGLGAKLDGECTFIKVAHKDNLNGLGFNDRDDQWTKHEYDFNTLLKSFDIQKEMVTSEIKDDNIDMTITDSKKTGKHIVCSDEHFQKHSKVSKARVNYKKSVRAKDITKYNEKDLANIFGKQTLNEEILPSSSQNEVEVEKDAHDFGITTIQTGISSTDYFKTKKNAHKKQKVEHPTMLLSETDELNSNNCLEKNAEENLCNNDNMPKETNDLNVELSTSKRRKKRKNQEITKDQDNESESTTNTHITTENDQENENQVKLPKRKKKNKSLPKIYEDISLPDFILNICEKLENSAENSNSQIINNEKTPNSLNLKQLYKIDSFKVDVFRFLEMDAFINSSLSNINGYGFAENFELKVKVRNGDSKRLNNFWDQTLINKYGADVIKPNKRKSFNKLRKKNVFKSFV